MTSRKKAKPTIGDKRKLKQEEDELNSKRKRSETKHSVLSQAEVKEDSSTNETLEILRSSVKEEDNNNAEQQTVGSSDKPPSTTRDIITTSEVEFEKIKLLHHRHFSRSLNLSKSFEEWKKVIQCVQRERKPFYS